MFLPQFLHLVMRLPSGKRRLPILLLTQPQGRCRAASWLFFPTRSHHDSPPRAIGTKGIFADCCEATSFPTLSLETHIESKALKNVKQSLFVFLCDKDKSCFMTHDAGRLRVTWQCEGAWTCIIPVQLKILRAIKHLLSGQTSGAAESL